MKQISKPDTSKIDNIIPLAEDLHALNEVLDMNDPDELMEAIWKLKEIEALVWEIDSKYWSLLSKFRGQ